MNPDSILVAGGGIGGLSAALALAHGGYAVHLVERASDFSELGTGIQIGPNAFRMAERLGIHAAVAAKAMPLDALTLRCAVRGHEILRVPLGEGFVARFGHPYAVIHRADLHAALVDACRAQPWTTMQSARHVNGFTQDDAGVTLELLDGRPLRGAALVGADGIWSTLREQIIGDQRPRASGDIAFRAVVPMAQVPPALRGNEVAIWAGPHLHLAHYPLPGAAQLNIVAVFRSDRFAGGWNQIADPAMLWDQFRDTRPEVQDLLRQIETWRYWVLRDREPVRGWTQGRATLLGDAAHPALPYAAQGATMAIEDAVCLADQLALHGGAVPQAFAAYEEARMLRTARVQVTARLLGTIYHAAGVQAELRDRMLGPGGEAAWDAMAWLFGGPDWPGMR